MTPTTYTANLSHIAELNPKMPQSVTPDTHVSFVPMSAVSAEAARTIDVEWRFYSDVSKGYTPFLNGDILVAKITPCFENGKIAQATLSHSIGFGSTEFHVVRPNDGEVDARYLLHFLRQGSVRRDGERRMTGSAGQRRVPEHFLGSLEIPLPPLPEQRRIAAILDQADGLRTKRRAAIAQPDTLAQSIFFDMFLSSARGSGPFAWEPLGHSLCFVTSGSRGWAKYYSTSGARFVRSMDVLMNSIANEDVAFVNPPNNAEARRTVVHAGDVLLTITGSVGRVVVAPQCLEGAYISQHVAILRLNRGRLLPTFVAHFLAADQGGQRRIAAAQYGQTKPGLNLEQIRGIEIPVPTIDLQCEFERRVWATDGLRAKHLHSLAHLDALFASLQHSAFRGEL